MRAPLTPVSLRCVCRRARATTSSPSGGLRIVARMSHRLAPQARPKVTCGSRARQANPPDVALTRSSGLQAAFADEHEPLRLLHQTRCVARHDVDFKVKLIAGLQSAECGDAERMRDDQHRE